MLESMPIPKPRAAEFRPTPKVDFGSFAVEPDRNRRAAKPGWPCYKLKRHPNQGWAKFMWVSTWSLQVCDLLSHHDWYPEDQDVQLIDSARATLNYLVICEPSLSPTRIYDSPTFKKGRALRLCKKMLKISDEIDKDGNGASDVEDEEDHPLANASDIHALLRKSFNF